MAQLSEDDLKSLLGEGIHTALRKAGDSRESQRAWEAIAGIAGHEWEGIIEFLVWGLDVSGVVFCYKHKNGEYYPIIRDTVNDHG